MPTTASARLNMEKPSQEQQQQQETLRCPRCDSSNTKFCYYNNYSLSQPRHFCKACKRYWTRGGTLRNVPVGGGCRKNKRIKRHPALDPAAASTPCTLDITTSAATTANSSITSASVNKTSIFNHLAGVSGFGAVPPMGLEGLKSSSNGLDLPPILSSLWLNFPANATTTLTDHHHQHHLDHYSNQNPNHIGQEHANSTSLPHDYSLLGSSTSSLLTSSLQQQKLMMGMRENRAFNDFQFLFPTVDLHQSTTINNGSSSFFKGLKMELQEGHPLSNIPCNTSINDLPLASSDHVNTYWNTGGVGANNWPEATNLGSSMTPLI